MYHVLVEDGLDEKAGHYMPALPTQCKADASHNSGMSWHQEPWESTYAVGR